MGRADRISGAFWLCFSVLVIIESYRLGLGTLHQPGPGFLFFWVNIALGIMSLIVLIRACAGKKDEDRDSALFGGQNTLKIILVLISLFLYAIFMESLGFVVVTLLLFVFLLGLIEKKRWLFTLSVSVAVTAISYLIFEIWLKTMLPGGMLGYLGF